MVEPPGRRAVQAEGLGFELHLGGSVKGSKIQGHQVDEHFILEPIKSFFKIRRIDYFGRTATACPVDGDWALTGRAGSIKRGVPPEIGMPAAWHEELTEGMGEGEAVLYRQGADHDLPDPAQKIAGRWVEGRRDGADE